MHWFWHSDECGMVTGLGNRVKCHEYWLIVLLTYLSHLCLISVTADNKYVDTMKACWKNLTVSNVQLHNTVLCICPTLGPLLEGDEDEVCPSMWVLKIGDYSLQSTDERQGQVFVPQLSHLLKELIIRLLISKDNSSQVKKAIVYICPTFVPMLTVS